MKHISYSNFTEFMIPDNATSVIDLKLKTFTKNTKIYCHAVDKLTNSSLETINKRSLELVKPVKCILTLFLIINGNEVIRTYDLSNYITDNINFSVDIFSIKDINGIALSESDNIYGTVLTYENATIVFTINNSLKYKSQSISFYLKDSEDVEILNVEEINETFNLDGIEFTYGEGTSFWLPEGSLSNEYQYIFQYSVFPEGLSSFIDSDWPIYFNTEDFDHPDIDPENKWTGGTSDSNMIRMRIKNVDLNEYSNVIVVPYPWLP